MDTIVQSVSNLAVAVLMLFLWPTVLLLLTRRFVPVLGERLWRAYCRLIMWLLAAPFRLARLLVNEIITAARRR